MRSGTVLILKQMRCDCGELGMEAASGKLNIKDVPYIIQFQLITALTDYDESPGQHETGSEGNFDNWRQYDTVHADT
jgi:hypothetical protein